MGSLANVLGVFLSILLPLFHGSQPAGRSDPGFAMTATNGVPDHQLLPLHRGLEIFTHDNQPTIAMDAIGLRFSGPISYPLAENLKELLLQHPQKYDHVVLDLNSEGGEISYVKQVIAVLKTVRERMEFTTRVSGGRVCASGCIALFMQGNKRKASNASAWVFHGACSAGSNLPSLDATNEYLGLLEDGGASPDFLCMLIDQGYVTQPGALFLSGYELFHVQKAGIITELLPAWQPQKPVFPPVLVPR